MKVIDLLHYKNFSSLVENHNVTDFGATSKGSLLSSLNNLYKKEDITRYGVLGIVIKLIEA